MRLKNTQQTVQMKFYDVVSARRLPVKWAHVREELLENRQEWKVRVQWSVKNRWNEPASQRLLSRGPSSQQQPPGNIPTRVSHRSANTPIPSRERSSADSVE